jgi:hypothetical protein
VTRELAGCVWCKDAEGETRASLCDVALLVRCAFGGASGVLRGGSGTSCALE